PKAGKIRSFGSAGALSSATEFTLKLSKVLALYVSRAPGTMRFGVRKWPGFSRSREGPVRVKPLRPFTESGMTGFGAPRPFPSARRRSLNCTDSGHSTLIKGTGLRAPRCRHCPPIVGSARQAENPPFVQCLWRRSDTQLILVG